jgi:nitrite reductase (NADH) small subunit/3-phenylpropionate/trans-cinnamate dioxygenase ferredoxin subunit
MSEYVSVADAADISPGTGRTVVVDGRPIAVFNVEGTYHAIEGTCLHRGGPVGDGDLEGTTVTCPWHGWQYDVTTGHHLLDPSVGLTKHAVRVENGSVQIALAD